MAQRLKRWESPRREGRNDKGRGGSARQRQRRKQFQMLRNKLKEQPNSSQSQPRLPKTKSQKTKGEVNLLPPFLLISRRPVEHGRGEAESRPRIRIFSKTSSAAV